VSPEVGPSGARRPALRCAPVVIALAVTALLLAVGDRYGYFRDEFYYLASGRHLALGYVDNPPLTPWIARLEVAVLGDSPTALRVVPALATGLTVVVTGRIARELGGDRVAATVAAACAAGSAFLLATGHVLSTSTIDLLVWTMLSWLVLRGLRDGGRVWLGAGVVAGVGLLDKALVAALLGVLALGVLAVGPREVFRDRWLWLGVVIAVAIWTPHLVWQGLHGWPLLTFSERVATVGNGGSAPRWTFPLFQFIEVSPLLVPVWAVGLWTLVRRPDRRWARAFAIAYGLLFVLLIVVGGKHYYLAGMYPVLLAAGAVTTVGWVRARAVRARGSALAVLLVVNAVVVALLMLPIIPARSLPGSPVAAVQPIPAESVGWPELVATVGAAARSLPAEDRGHAVILTRNYGEAGAIDLFRAHPDHADLPPVYSGHNSYADWGPPPEAATTVVAVGIDEARLERWFTSVRLVARIDNALGVANDERGAPVWIASGRRVSWASIWAGERRLA
jgi:4-amino-4-deoxy-L-arabinose transferase-like glycosyltransferase